MSEGSQTRSSGDAEGRERNGKEAGRIPSGRLAQKPKKRGPPAPPKKCVKKPSLVTVVFPQVDLQGQKELLLALCTLGRLGMSASPLSLGALQRLLQSRDFSDSFSAVILFWCRDRRQSKTPLRISRHAQDL